MVTEQYCYLRYRYNTSSSTLAMLEDESSIEDRNPGGTWDYEIIQFACYRMAPYLE
jgi:hypothetical protein